MCVKTKEKNRLCIVKEVAMLFFFSSSSYQVPLSVAQSTFNFEFKNTAVQYKRKSNDLDILIVSKGINSTNN